MSLPLLIILFFCYTVLDTLKRHYINPSTRYLNQNKPLLVQVAKAGLYTALKFFTQDYILLVRCKITLDEHTKRIVHGLHHQEMELHQWMHQGNILYFLYKLYYHKLMPQEWLVQEAEF